MQGFVTTTDLKLDAVIHPALCTNQDFFEDCPLVSVSNFTACSGIT